MLINAKRTFSPGSSRFHKQQIRGLFYSVYSCTYVDTLGLCLFPEYNISAAAIAIFSLAFIILGSLCLIGSCTGKGKGRDYLLKPAGMFFAFAGEFGFFFFPPT